MNPRCHHQVNNVRRLAVLTMSTLLLGLVASAADNEWINLFDGQSLKGWTPRGQADMKVVGGEIHLTAQKNVWVVTDLKLQDFVLEVEAKVAEGDHVNSSCSGSRETSEKRKSELFRVPLRTSDAQVGLETSASRLK